MKLQTRYYGHPDLRMKAKPIEELNEQVLKTIHDMLETMLSYDNCIGFAGPQLGVALRVFVIREEKMNPQGGYFLSAPEVIINPVLSKPSKELISMEEGCMSLPGVYVEVARPQGVHVRYQNVKGEFVEEDLVDFRARMFMHENDHLNGVLTIDRMPAKDRPKIEPMLRALKQKYN